MKKITIENYEIFVEDYLNGTLALSVKEDMDIFMDKNPSIKEEVQSLKECFLIADENRFYNKSILYRSIENKEITSTNVDEFIILQLEKELNEFNSKRLDNFLEQDPVHAQDKNLLEKTFLKPDLSVTYKNKRSLLKKSGANKKIIIFSWIAAAAIFIFIISVYWKNSYQEKGNIVQPEEYTRSETRNDQQVSPNSTAKEKTPDEPGKTYVTNVPPKSSATSVPENIQTSSHIETGAKQSVSDISLEPRKMIQVKVLAHQIDENIHPVVIYKTKQPEKHPEEYVPVEDYLISLVKKTIVPDKKPADINIWAIADAGLKGFNKLTESDYSIERKEKPDPETNKFSLKLGNISISATKKNN